MYRRAILPLLLALTIAVAAACAPAVGPEQAASRQASQPIVEPPAEATASAEAAEPDAGEVITSGESVTGVQRLDWDADAENCLMPGAVITDAGADLPPCEPAPEEPTPVAEESDAMPTELPLQEPAPAEPAAQEPAQPQALGDEAARMAALAVDDLAQQLGVPAGDIQVREVRAVIWPDSSLGCPEPGMMYAQAEQDGYLIRLSARGEIYHYHSGGGQAPFLCEQSLQLQAPDPRATDEFLPPPGFDEEKTD